MNFDDLVLGWREALLGVVALLVLYVAIVFFRLRRLRRNQPAEPSPESSSPSPALTDEQVAASRAKADFPWNEPPDAPGVEVRLSSLETELNGLRTEISSLRSELATMSGSVDTLRSEWRRELERVDEHVQASQHVAPIYGDAMQMALAGHDAATIAERCGVARAEAELVVALIRNRDDGLAPEENRMTMRER